MIMNANPIAQPRDAGSWRERCAAGAWSGSTAGLAPGFVQGNVAILPAAHADAFAEFCRANQQACPLLAVSKPGETALPALGAGIDIRHDLPRYRVFHDGVCVSEPASVAELWRDDLVTFVIGCSFTFERALLANGVPVRHIAAGRNVPMYRTSIPTRAVPPFGGALVVSLRPMPPAQAGRAAAICAHFPTMHGAPVHQGDPREIGIRDLSRPDFGDPPAFEAGDIPVFWACGVTSQVALEAARLPFAITHAPGCMLITDLPEPAWRTADADGAAC
jgi:uncharacterized protein YcsI (UPF0317 family)